MYRFALDAIGCAVCLAERGIHSNTAESRGDAQQPIREQRRHDAAGHVDAHHGAALRVSDVIQRRVW